MKAAASINASATSTLYFSNVPHHNVNGYITETYSQYINSPNKPYSNFTFNLLNIKSHIKSFYIQAFRFYNKMHFQQHFINLVYTLHTQIPEKSLIILFRGDIHNPIGEFIYWGMYILNELGDNAQLNESLATCMAKIYSINKPTGLFYMNQHANLPCNTIQANVVAAFDRFGSTFKAQSKETWYSLASFINQAAVDNDTGLVIDTQNEVN